jgi:hypothetical protein
MNDRPRSLEDTLTALAGGIAFPLEPDLAPQVRARIRGPVVLHATPRHRTLLRFAVAALVLSLVATGVLFFSPTSRRAVADWLGVSGIHISTTPKRLPSNLGRRLNLGPQVTLAQANTRLGARVRLPSGPGVGAPDEIHTDPANPIVWLVYRPSSALPAAAGHDVGLLVTEIRSNAIYRSFYKKLLGTGATIRNVAVNGVPGFWIQGQPHLIEYRFPLGIRQEKGRISGNSLIWSSGGITYRLELARGIRAAETIATSLR